MSDDLVPGFLAETNDDLDIKLEKINEIPDCLKLTLSGKINTYNSLFFQKQIQKAIEVGFVRLIFSCKGLNYLSSTGIGSFVSFVRTLKQKDGGLVLIELQPSVYEVFQLLGVSQFINNRAGMDEAINFFNTL